MRLENRGEEGQRRFLCPSALLPKPDTESVVVQYLSPRPPTVAQGITVTRCDYFSHPARSLLPICQFTARRHGQRTRPRFAWNYLPQDLPITSTVAANMHGVRSPRQRPLLRKSPPSTLLLSNNQSNYFLLSSALYCSDKCQLANLNTSHGTLAPDYDLGHPLGPPVPHDTPLTLSLGT